MTIQLKGNFMEMFELFLKAHLKDKYDYRKLNATTLLLDGSRRAYHYYVDEDNPLGTEIMINQIDEWVINQGGAINRYEDLVANIIEEHKIQVSPNVFFTVISRDGIGKEDFLSLLYNEEHKPKARFQRTQMFMEKEGITRFTGEQYIYVDLDIMYTGIEACDREFNMVKLFLNSLRKKMEAKTLSTSSLKEIYTYYNLNEQTFYSWKRKNPAVFEAICDAYFYKEIKEIISALVEIPSMCKETWGTRETMKYLNGEEF